MVTYRVGIERFYAECPTRDAARLLVRELRAGMKMGRAPAVTVLGVWA
jgi:hypothetical protein